MESSSIVDEDPKTLEKLPTTTNTSLSSSSFSSSNNAINSPEEFSQVGEEEYEKNEEVNNCQDYDLTEDQWHSHSTTTTTPNNRCPPLSPPQSPSLSPLNDELQHGFRILRELMSDSNKAVNWPFLNAVDDSWPEVEDYYEKISRPMWMKKMRISFEKREYKTINEFVADFRLMLENCYRYNGPDSYISKRGQRLETMLGQKLALLPRNLRDKISYLAADITSSPEEIAIAAGLRRRSRAVGPQDSSALLNQLRQEEVIKEKKARKQHIEERRAAQEAHVQEVIGWEDILLEEPLNSQMKAMWELPQIGHFLFLCQEPLYLAEVPQYELERCFLMARESTTMQRIMSSLLSTPHQRTKLYNHRHRMPYRVWEEKLQVKMKYWYDVLESFEGDKNKAAEKLGLDPFAFDVMGKTNPLLRKKYHELGYYRKVWIMKSVCDHVLELQDSLREAIELQPPEEQREYNLGSDAEGNVYIHFPQFCGADLRVYRHKPFPDLDMENENEENCNEEKDVSIKPNTEKVVKSFSPVKKKNSIKSQVAPEVIVPPSVRPSRLRQKIKTILPSTLALDGDDEDEDNDNEDRKKITDIDYIDPIRKIKKRGRKKKYVSQSNIFCSWITSSKRRFKKNGSFRLPTYLTQKNFLKFSKTKDFKKYKSTAKKTVEQNTCNDYSSSNFLNVSACKLHGKKDKLKTESEKTSSEILSSEGDKKELSKKDIEDPLDNKLISQIKQEISCESSNSNEDKKEICTCIDNNYRKNNQTDIKPLDELSDETKSDIFKTDNEISTPAAICKRPLKSLSSPRKHRRGIKSRFKSYKLKLSSIKKNEPQENHDENGSSSECQAEKDEVDLELEPEIGSFELIVDSVQDLRELVARFESEPQSSTNSKGRRKSKQPVRKKCVIDLHARLTYLLKELEPWEAKLIQANQKARRKMKREQETYKEEIPRKELRTRANQSNLSPSQNTSKNATPDEKTELGRGKRNVRSLFKSTASRSLSSLTSVKSISLYEDESPDISSRGRLRKRRIIPNNIENEFNIKKRKSPRIEENKKANASSKNKNNNNNNNAKSEKASSSKTTKNKNASNPISSLTIDAQTGIAKQSSYPVIHQLLLNGQSAVGTAQNETKIISSKVIHSKNAFSHQKVLTTTPNLIKLSNTTPTATINLSSKLLNQQSVSTNSSGQAGTSGKIQYYTQLCNLTPQILQQLLRNATVSKADNDPDNKGKRTFVLSSAAIGHPNNIIPQGNLTNQDDKSKKSTILISPTPIPHSSAAFTPSSTVITSASANTGSKPVFQNSNIQTVLPHQFQVLLRTSDSSTQAVTPSPKMCKSSAKTQKGPVYVISKPGVAPHILNTGSKLTTNLPVKTVQSLQAGQNPSGVIITTNSSTNLVNLTLPSSVAFNKNDKSTLLIQTMEPAMQTQAVDTQLSSTSENNPSKSPGKYGGNVTVKSLLENRVTKKPVDVSAENIYVTNGANVQISQPISVCNTKPAINNPVVNLNPTLSSSVNDSAHVAKNTCLLSTVQSQLSDIRTEQTAPNLKVTSPIMLPSVQPCQNITQTIQSTKTPVTVTPHLMSTADSTKNNNVLASNQANVLQSFSSGSNLRVNIPQPTLLTQPALMSLKQSTGGRSVAFIPSGSSLTGSKNVILKVVPQNLVTATSLGSELSSNRIINLPKAAGQTNLQATRKMTPTELKQLGSLPQHILTTVNPSVSKPNPNTTLQNVLTSKPTSTPIGLQIAPSSIPLTVQKANNQSILLLSSKDQNLQQQPQKKSIGVIPINDQYNSKELLKKVSTVHQVQGSTLQIIPSQGNNPAINNIATIQGQLLQSENGNIILAPGSSIPTTGNITQLLHSSLNNHLTVTNLKADVQQVAKSNSTSVIETNVTNTSNKGKAVLNTSRILHSNTGTGNKLKTDNSTSFQLSSSNFQLDTNNLFDNSVIANTASSNNPNPIGSSQLRAVSSNVNSSLIENRTSVSNNNAMPMLSSLVQPISSSEISSTIVTNPSQCINQHSAFPTCSSQTKTVSIPQSVSTSISKSGEITVATTTMPTAKSILNAHTTKLHPNISFLNTPNPNTPSSITQQQTHSQGMLSSNSIFLATCTTSAKATDNIVTQKSIPSQLTTMNTTSTITTTATEVSKIISKLSSQNIQTNLSQIKPLGQTVPSSTQTKNTNLQHKSSPSQFSSISQAKLQTLVPPKQAAAVGQAQTTILSNNVLNLGQTNTSNVGIPQLVLYNIGGQLVTPQGIPVTLENGVLKIMPSPIVTQNQVMFVQSPNPPVVGSPQVQTISTPYSDLLKTIKPSSSSSTILLPESSLNTTTSVRSTIDVPSQVTHAVPAQGILSSGTELLQQQQHSLKVVSSLGNTQEPSLEGSISTAQTHKVPATNNANKTFLLTSPSTVVNKDLGIDKQHVVSSSNLSDQFLKKPQSILSPNTKPGTVVFMDPNNLPTKHSVFYPVTMADTQSITKPISGNVVIDGNIVNNKPQLAPPIVKTKEKEDSFEGAAILLSLARQPTVSSPSSVNIVDNSVISYGKLESVNHENQPE